MLRTMFPLYILFLGIIYADPCEDIGPMVCSDAENCEWNEELSECQELDEGDDDGVPDCILDCPGIEDIISDNPYQLCEWIISFNGTDCTADCEEELLFSFEYTADACENCLSNDLIDCTDIFGDGDHDDTGDDGPPECTLDCPGVFDLDSDNPDEICDWIVSINGTECMQDCDEETVIGFEYLSDACYDCLSVADIDCADVFEDDNDDGGNNIYCSDINNSEECYESGCEWSTVTTPNGVFEMCVEPGFSDGGGWEEDGCFENGEWYCYGCELFVNECEYYECTEDGWAGPFENPNCNDWGCSDLGEEECIQAPDCQPNYDVAGQFEGCLESDNDGPPECLLDCEGIEYVDPSENADEACDWIISNFGPNNFFNECAEDCDEETMDLINQLVEACYACLSDENFDCGDVFDDEGENSCSDLSQDECESLDYCEWVWYPAIGIGECVEAGPNGDDGGTGGGDGCFDNAGEWYCYGCELFVNDCEYYECTENGWTGPFVIDNCWEGCIGLSVDECIDASNCVWVFAEDNPNTPYGYCMESEDNPPGEDFAVLRLEHTVGLPGTTVQIPLLLSNSESVGGIQFSIELDSPYNNNPGLIVEEFEIINDCFSASYNEINNQMIGIVFSLEGCVYPASDHAHIGNILMYISEDMPLGSELPLSFIYTLVSDPSGNEIPSYGETSSITIGIQGDVNYDGEVNILDIVTIVSFAIYAEEPSDSQFWASDINNDGMINILDIVQLINVVLGD